MMCCEDFELHHLPLLWVAFCSGLWAPAVTVPGHSLQPLLSCSPSGFSGTACGFTEPGPELRLQGPRPPPWLPACPRARAATAEDTGEPHTDSVPPLHPPCFLGRFTSVFSPVRWPLSAQVPVLLFGDWTAGRCGAGRGAVLPSGKGLYLLLPF